MKAITYYIVLIVIAMILIASHSDYKSEVEEDRIEKQMERCHKAEAHADSLGLTGQDRIDFINNY